MPLKTCPVCRGSRVVRNIYTNKSYSCSYCGGSGTIVVDEPRRYESDVKKRVDIKKKK